MVLEIASLVPDKNKFSSADSLAIIESIGDYRISINIVLTKLEVAMNTQGEREINEFPNVTVETFKQKLKDVEHPREHGATRLRARMARSLLRVGEIVARYHFGEDSHAVKGFQHAISHAKGFSYGPICTIKIDDGKTTSLKNDVPTKDLHAYFESCLNIVSRQPFSKGKYYETLKEGLLLLPVDNSELFPDIAGMFK